MICIYDTIRSRPLRRVYRRAVICRVSWDVFSWKCFDVRQNVGKISFQIGLAALTIRCWWNQGKPFHQFPLSQQTDVFSTLKYFLLPKEILHAKIKMYSSHIVVHNMMEMLLKNIVLIHNHKYHSGLNLFAITVHINCNPVLLTWAKHSLQSGTCLLETVDWFGILVENISLSQSQCELLFPLFYLTSVGLSLLIHLSWKKVQRDWSFCLWSHPIALERVVILRRLWPAVSALSRANRYMNIWPGQTFINITAGLKLVLEDWFVLLNRSCFHANTPVKHQYISIKPSYCKCHPIRHQWPHNRRLQADWRRWSFFEYLR